jgi:hypothetical protein
LKTRDLHFISKKIYDRDPEFDKIDCPKLIAPFCMFIFANMEVNQFKEIQKKEK